MSLLSSKSMVTPSWKPFTLVLVSLMSMDKTEETFSPAISKQSQTQQDLGWGVITYTDCVCPKRIVCWSSGGPELQAHILGEGSGWEGK